MDKLPYLVSGFSSSSEGSGRSGGSRLTRGAVSSIVSSGSRQSLGSGKTGQTGTTNGTGLTILSSGYKSTRSTGSARGTSRSRTTSQSRWSLLSILSRCTGAAGCSRLSGGTRETGLNIDWLGTDRIQEYCTCPEGPGGPWGPSQGHCSGKRRELKAGSSTAVPEGTT